MLPGNPEQFEKEIVDIQRGIRSNQRKNLHISIFKENPSTDWPKLNVIPEYFHSELHRRLESAIADITKNQKIINEKLLYHYTSISNLKSILQYEHIYGHEFLNNNNIKFDENTWDHMDKFNGDSKVIFFCPGQVDYNAFSNSDNNLKPDRCRLTIDIEKVSNKRDYNQFIKLSDFMAPFWSFTFKFGNTSILFKMEGKGGLNISFPCYHMRSSVTLTKNEMIYYGNIFKINRFCAVQLFNIINKLDNNELKESLYNGMNNLSNADLAKLIITFAQSMTLFAEYNFNAALSINEIKIKEILILGEKRIKYDFSTLEDTEYNAALNHLSLSSFDQLTKYLREINDEDTIYQTPVNNINHLSIFGLKTRINNPGMNDFGVLDAKELPNDLFDTSNYIETRAGVGGNISLSK